ncbi:MAG: sigma-70 family RNA polymerase sigma factor [Acidobacteriia bacterium]|nr:sigma-70 family RNA polymerase sigma factor [Terriglobia bacterium]
MTGQPQHEVTGLLQAWRSGDRAALDQLMPLVYAELHRLAHFYLARERPGNILQTSALVNESYLRLIDASRVDWRDRAHFFAVAARIMRQVLMQNARWRHAGKRGGSAVRVEFNESFLPAPERDEDLIALDDALIGLARTDPREAQVVELRFFGGLSEEETAHVLGVSDRTVRREWDHAKVWLLRELKHGARA